MIDNYIIILCAVSGSSDIKSSSLDAGPEGLFLPAALIYPFLQIQFVYIH